MTMPLFYYYHDDSSSDRNWIESRMRLIPDSKKQAVADRYDIILRKTKKFDRKRANTFLNKVAKMYNKKRTITYGRS